MNPVEGDWPVEVWIYDLSRGMARSMSMQLLGQHIEGIWHSSIVVYGEEYFYGGGISRATPPGSTVYGVPVRKVLLGRTQIPRELFHEFIENIREKYLPERYHLLDNNCNNFSNDVAVFLTGKTIPEDVRGLPQEVLATPFGQMLRPMIDGMFQQQPSEAVQKYTRPSGAPAGVGQSISGEEIIRHVSSLDEMMGYIQNHKGVIVDFDSPFCGPCISLAPKIAQFARMYSEILFCKVDVPTHRDIANHYNVRATPTILAFVNGNLIDTILGANVAQIEAAIRTMLHSIKDQQKAQRDILITSLPNNPILFEHMQVEMVFKKLRSLIPKDKYVDQINELERFLSLTDFKVFEVSDSLARAAFQVYGFLSEDDRFILIDIFRMLILNAQLAKLAWNSSDST
jgi:desumoylating isopeptidase 1